MNAPADIQLLLIGPTGHGRSATGNSILGRHYFSSSSSPTSLTSEIECGLSEFGSRRVKVVDGPGVGLTHTNEQKAVNLHKASMEYAIAANPHGYDAFLLVVRFGERYTTEVAENFYCLRKIFGQDFVRNYCILVVTCGDLFKQEKGNVRKSFEEWIDENPGALRDLANECERRVVLFDNVTTDGTRHEQVQKLYKMVDNLKSKGNRYTDEDFAQAREGRLRYIAETQKVLIQEEAMLESNLILKATEDIQLLEDLETKMAQLQAVQIRAHNLSQKIAALDNGTGVFKDMVAYLTWVKRYVDDQVKAHVKTLKESNVTNPHQNTALIMDEGGIKQQREQKNITIGKSSTSLDELETGKKRSEKQQILLGGGSREDNKKEDIDNEKQAQEETNQKCMDDQAQGKVKNMNENEIRLQTEQNSLTNEDGIKQATDDDATISKDLRSSNEFQATKNQQTHIQTGDDSQDETDPGDIVTQMQPQEEHCKDETDPGDIVTQMQPQGEHCKDETDQGDKVTQMQSQEEHCNEQMICQDTRNTDDEKTCVPGMPDNTLGASSNTIKKSEANQVDLLLIGRTGAGKSAVGNSILGCRVFESRMTSAPVTKTVNFEVCEVNGRVITVVDTPNFLEDRHGVLFVEAMETAIAIHPRGYNALILVLRYCSRFTCENEEIIDTLKNIFGQDFVKNVCILVMTWGDNFEADREETGLSFQQWCNEEIRPLKDLMNECDNRVVLFNNVCKDQAKKDAQVEQLLTLVDSLSSKGQRYTAANFACTRESRDHFKNSEVILTKAQKELDMIYEELNHLTTQTDSKSWTEGLKILRRKTDSFLESISSQGWEIRDMTYVRSKAQEIKSIVTEALCK